MSDFRAALKATDPDIYETLIGEERRQREGIKMIPSRTARSPRSTPRWARPSRTNTPRVIPAGAITAAPNSSMRWRTFVAIGPRKFSAPSTRTSSRCPARR